MTIVRSFCLVENLYNVSDTDTLFNRAYAVDVAALKIVNGVMLLSMTCGVVDVQYGTTGNIAMPDIVVSLKRVFKLEHNLQDK